MYIEASYKQHDAKARLVSPVYKKLSNTGCLSFFYHMWGRDIGTLKVYLRQGSTDTSLFSLDGDQGNQWEKSADIPINLSTNTFQIVFEASIAHNLGNYAEVLGDIAIDDVTVDRGSACGSVTNGPTTKSTETSSSAPPITTVSVTVGKTTPKPATDPTTSTESPVAAKVVRLNIDLQT